MTNPPVVHLPQRDYDNAAIRLDWRKTGYAVTEQFGDHPVREVCPQCSAEPEQAAPARDETLEALLDELGCMIHPAGEAGARATARRIFRYGTLVGWDRAVAAAGHGPGQLEILPADAMRSPGDDHPA